MNLGYMIVQEVGHRKLNFALTLLSLLIAVACITCLLTVLRGYQLRSDQVLAARQQAVKDEGDKLMDHMRKITKGMGFNVCIMPQDQNLSNFQLDGYASKMMPESYVDKLAESKILTVNHLLPTLEQKVHWEEQNRDVLLVGTRGEVAFTGRKAKKPLISAVQPGKIILGYQLHKDLNLKKGDKITFLRREFTIQLLREPTGIKTDVQAFLPLPVAQELLDKKDQINAIWALNCNCASGDRLTEIQAEISQELPDTQVIELGQIAEARAQGRMKATEQAKASLESTKKLRSEVGQQLESFATVTAPVVLIACGVWVAFLTLGNVQDRRYEIGILRAIGLRSSQILVIFLGKVFLASLFAAVLGTLLGVGVGHNWYQWEGEALAQQMASQASNESTKSSTKPKSESQPNKTPLDKKESSPTKPAAQAKGAIVAGKDLPTNPPLLSMSFVLLLSSVLVGTPVLGLISSWLPAFMAAQQDPARILSEE